MINNGDIISAVQEERFTRKKNDDSFPTNSIKYCLEKSCISLKELDYIVFYEKPFIKFERLIETYLAFAPRGFNSFNKAIPIWAKQKLFQKQKIITSLKNIDNDADIEGKLLFSEHHLSHAASTFFPSPFSEAAIITLDGVGEWATTISIGRANEISIIKEMNFPHSLGLFYSWLNL